MGQIVHNHIYLFCMVIFPLFTIYFFTDMMEEGLPADMPAGIVDFDRSSASRTMIRNLDAMQLVEVSRYYANVSEARRAMQRGEIYGFFVFPEHMKADLLASRQPEVSFYYNGGILLAGSMIYKSMRTEATLGAASVAMYKMAAMGMSEKEIAANLQPIVVDTRMINNPTLDYNVYLSTSLIPMCIALFIFLISAYAVGTELKFNRARDWMQRARHNIYLAMLGKMVPLSVIFVITVWAYIFWLFGIQGFPHQCSTVLLLLNGVLMVLACEGLAIFIFGMIPSLRMSMSISALWAVLSFSVSGFTFPVEGMDTALQGLTWLFPMRSYFMIYQMVVLNGYDLYYAWEYYLVLILFALLPLLVLPRIKKVMETYVYIA